MQRKTTLAFVGGFLGAGKTTLILKAAELLKASGKRVAIITNDQSSGTVDSKLVNAAEFQASEIAGGCFCCRFSDLIGSAEALLRYSPDVIFAEPVGSCVDLSATILQPLKANYNESFELAPLTVLIDPILADQVERKEAAPEIRFLFEHQLSEADIICASKADVRLPTGGVRYPIDFELSGRTGTGVAEWLDEILGTRRVAGSRLLAVDYDEYARSEAALGWVNLHAFISLYEAQSPIELAGPVLDEIRSALKIAGIWIAHLKVFDRCPSGWITATITEGQEPWPNGELVAEPTKDHELAINLRAVGDPIELKDIVQTVVGGIAGATDIRHLAAFRPAKPQPEFRFGELALT